MKGSNAELNKADMVYWESSGFPFFCDQICTLHESDLLTDAEHVEYLPKFVTGEALEVVKQNRGCSFNNIMKTLEEHFGQTIRVI